MGTFAKRQRAQIRSHQKLTSGLQMARVYHMNDEVLEVRSTVLAKYDIVKQANTRTSAPH